MKKQLSNIKSKQVFKNKKINIGFLAVFVLSLSVFGYLLIRSFAAPGNGNANIVLSAPSTDVVKGTNVTVTARVNTNTEQVNAAHLKINYDASKLQYVSTDASQSAFSIDAPEAMANGTVLITRGDSVLKSGNLEIVKITFKALVDTGNTTLDLTNESAVANSGDDVTGTLTDLLLNFKEVPDTTPPSAPSNLRTDAKTTNSIQFSWNASTDNKGVTGYRVYVNNVLTQTVTSTQFNVTGLNASTQYALAVSAIDGAGNESARSQTLTANTVKLGDVNNDDKIDVFDLSKLLSRWQTQTANDPSDLNKDGIVNVFDLSLMLSRWGT